MDQFQLTGFQRDLLYIIAPLDKPSGQHIKNQIDENFEVDTNLGRLYPNLDMVIEEGLVTKGELDRRTNYYELTEAGKEALITRREWEEQRISL